MKAPGYLFAWTVKVLQVQNTLQAILQRGYYTMEKGNRPVFSKWQYNFNADDNGYLYDRNLDLVLDNTPWKYSQLKNYYQADKSPFYVIDYLKRFLDYPMLEYLVKLGLYRLAEELVNPNYYYYMLDYAINKKGKSIYGVLGLGKAIFRCFGELIRAANN